MYPSGHYVRTLGAIGDRETETEASFCTHLSLVKIPCSVWYSGPLFGPGQGELSWWLRRSASCTVEAVCLHAVCRPQSHPLHTCT